LSSTWADFIQKLAEDEAGMKKIVVIRAIKVVVGTALLFNVVLAANKLWPSNGPNLYTLLAKSYCPLKATLYSLRDTQRIINRGREINRECRVIKQEDGLSLWETPAGKRWEPAGDSEMGNLLAEQESEIYGAEQFGVQPGDVVLDCGANIGEFTKTALRHGARLVVAIEPGPAQVRCIRLNLAQEIADGRVMVYPKGVWDHEDTMKLNLNTENAGEDTLIDHGTNTPFVMVPLTTIDNLVAELKLPRVNFIKMDIEGAEKPALAGAKRTIQSYHPRFALSPEHFSDDMERLPAIVKAIDPSYKTGGSERCICGSGIVRPAGLYLY
jgi:FkbM family methyltransferase